MSEASTSAALRGDRRRWIALIVVCLAMLMNALDSSIVNVALPKIQRSLDFSQSDLTWVIDAYLIAFGAFLLLAGRLGDLVGRKRVFLVGVALFTVSSAACAAASSQAMLIAARFVEGLGGAVSTSVIIAIIVTEFPAPAERARAMSAYMMVAVGGGSIGLLAGGLLTQAANWHWIFLINLPIGIATLIAGWILIEDDTGRGLQRGAIDALGSLLVTAAMLVGTYGIVKSSQYGWGSPHTLGSIAAGVLLLAAFIWREATTANPIMPLRVFSIRSLAASSAVRGCLFSGLYGVFFLGALYLERIGGYSPLRTGFAFLPMTLVVIVFSMGLTARLLRRFGALRLLVPGVGAMVAGLALIGLIGVHVHYAPLVLPAFLLVGFGMGIAGVPLLTLAMAEVPAADAGLASGIANVSMWLSSAIGLAVLSTVAASRSTTLAAGGHSVAASLTGGYRLSFLIAAAVEAVGLTLVLTLLRAPARKVAEAAAADHAALAAEAA